MAQPYSVDADVLNQTLTVLIAEAAWSTTPTTDVTLRIQEGDAEIDSRLAALGYTIPFSSNPPLLKQLSVMYARYACFRDLYAGGSPTAGASAEQKFKDAFEEKFQKLEDGWASLVDSTGAVIAPTKFDVTVAQNTTPVDNAPGQIISSYVSDFDENDSLIAETGSDDDDDE